MKDKTVVVTGGAGFIGSNLVRELASNNRVIVIDDLSTGHLQNIKDMVDSHKIEFSKGSITDLNLLQQKFRNVDYIFHEAAIPSVPRSIKDPISSNYVSVNGTLNVLVAARDAGVKKVVYASSSSVYGDTPTLPKSEDMELCPLSPYAIGKLAAEHYCRVFTELYGLSTISLRYFNVYGPRQDPYSEYAAVIPKFIMKIAKNESPIVYGDGEQTRDFSFVADVVAANILAAESKAVGVFNISGGKQISINNLIKIIIEIYIKDVSNVYNAARPGDIKHSLADISKAKDKLGYEPKFDLKKGLKETIKWFQKPV